MPRKATSAKAGTEPVARPPARKVVTRSPAHTVRVINLPHLQKAAIEADSSLERDFAYICLGFPFLRSILHQPFTLELPAGRYTPDFLVGFIDGSKAVVEVKPAAKVKRYKEKFAQAESKLASQSMLFVVAHDLLLKMGDLHERAKLIRRYAKGVYPPSEKALVMSALQQVPKSLTFKDLIERGIRKVTVLHMVAHQQLQIGADLDIGDAAIVSLPNQHSQEGSHAIRFASWLGA